MTITDNLFEAFEDRRKEVDSYIEFLHSIDTSAKNGPPRLEGAKHPISAQQQKILYSSVYLQLYNLVESTITSCIDSVAASVSENWQVRDLNESLRSEWVKNIARTHDELTVDNRLKAALELCSYLIDSRPIKDLSFRRTGAGNWDDNQIENIIRRIGFTLNVNPLIHSDVKRPFKDGKGSLALVKDLRNRLAHGDISFVECAKEVTVSDLENLKDNTVNYLREVVNNFILYLNGFEYLVPEKRPNK